MSKKTRSFNPSDPLKDATINALSQLLDPLLTLMFDTGISVREITHLLRERAVLKASDRIMGDTRTINRSRVSILTGLPRSEVTRLLRKRLAAGAAGRVQHPTRKLLSAWFDDSTFLSKDGEPAVLSVFGRRKSFERLVSKYGGGVPVRAMLDELTRIDAIEWLENQRIRPRHRIPMMTGLTETSISMMGERGRNLLETLLANAHATKNPYFEATALIENANAATISIGRREILQQGTSFIDGVDSLFEQLKRAPGKGEKGKVHTGKRMGVTVFYFEEGAPLVKGKANNYEIPRRKNLRRT